MTDDEGILVCSPKTSTRWVPAVTGRCADCGSEVWVSNTSRQAIAEYRLKTVCTTCAVLYSAKPDLQFQIHEGQRTELADMGVLSFAERLTQALNREREAGNE